MRSASERVDLGGRDPARAAATRCCRRASSHLGAERGEQVEHRLRVPDARDVVQHDLVLGQEGAGEQGQRGVLVAGRDDGARTTARRLR